MYMNSSSPNQGFQGRLQKTVIASASPVCAMLVFTVCCFHEAVLVFVRHSQYFVFRFRNADSVVMVETVSCPREDRDDGDMKQAERELDLLLCGISKLKL